MSRHLVAAAYLTAGWSVFPVTPGRKAPPLIEWTEFQSRHASVDEVREWWRQWPDANIGIVTGTISNLSVVDIDDGAGGRESLKASGFTFPLTRVHKTPGGFHLLFQHSMAVHTGAGFLKGIDVRSDGGYIVAPPSINVEKGSYSVLKDRPICPLLIVPEWLQSTSRKKDDHTPVDPSWVVDGMHGVGESQRNEMATRLIGYYHRKGLPPTVIATVMASFARACTPAMDERELDQTIRSVIRYPQGGRAMQTAWKGW